MSDLLIALFVVAIIILFMIVKANSKEPKKPDNIYQWNTNNPVQFTYEPQKPYKNIFKKYHEKAANCLSAIRYYDDVSTELVPMMIYLALQSVPGTSVGQFLAEAVEYYYPIMKNSGREQVQFERQELYNSFCFDEEIRLEWLPDNVSRPVYMSEEERAMCALFDILYNPDCADHYDDAMPNKKPLVSKEKMWNIYSNEFTKLMDDYMNELSVAHLK